MICAGVSSKAAGRVATQPHIIPILRRLWPPSLAISGAIVRLKGTIRFVFVSYYFVRTCPLGPRIARLRRDTAFRTSIANSTAGPATSAQHESIQVQSGGKMSSSVVRCDAQYDPQQHNRSVPVPFPRLDLTEIFRYLLMQSHLCAISLQSLWLDSPSIQFRIVR